MSASTRLDRLRRLAMGPLLMAAALGCSEKPAGAAGVAPAGAAPAPPAAGQPAAPPAPFSARIEPKFAPGQGPRIQGTVAIDPQFAAEAGGHPLVIILRSAQGRGMPIAVLRIENPRFPVDFDLGAEHAPLQSDDTPQILQAENKLVARLAISGVVTGGPEDLESPPVLVKAGGPKVELTLDHRRGP